MKRVLWCIFFISMLLVCTVVSVKTVYGTENFSGYEIDLVNDNSGVFITLKNNDTLYAKKIAPEGNEYKYKFENKIVASCIYDNKIYVLYDSSEQQDVSYVEQLQNGGIKKRTMLINLKHETVTQMSVDRKGNIYIINNKSRVDIFGRNGKYQKTLSDAFYSITPFNGKTYAANHRGIYVLGTDGFEKLGPYTDNFVIYRISDNYIGDKNGSVYRVESKVQKILNTGNKSICSCGETDNYLVSFSENKLNAYDKKNGKLINSIDLAYTPEAVSAYNNKVVALNTVNGIYSFESKNERVFNKQEAEQSHDNGETDSSSSLKFGKYKQSGEYIYIPRGTTYYRFKQSVTYNGYKIDFGEKRSGNIGTGKGVTFSKGKKKRHYTFIVLGDLTGEGNVNTRDIDALFAHLLESGSLNGVYKKAADLNGDGKISNADLVLTVRKYQEQRS